MFIFAQFTYVLAPTLVLAMPGLHAIPAKFSVPYEGPSVLHCHLLKVLAILQMVNLRALDAGRNIVRFRSLIIWRSPTSRCHVGSCLRDRTLVFLLSFFFLAFVWGCHCREDAIWYDLHIRALCTFCQEYPQNVVRLFCIFILQLPMLPGVIV